MAEGKLDLIVAAGAAWSDYRIKAEGIDPASFGDQLAQVAALESSTTLVAVLEQRAQGAVRGQQFPRRGDRIAATQAGAQEDRQQFRIRQRGGPACEQFFAGTFGGGPVADVHESRESGIGNRDSSEPLSMPARQELPVTGVMQVAAESATVWSPSPLEGEGLG